MPGWGASPGATLPRGACSLMPHRSPALPSSTRPGSHRSLSRARAGSPRPPRAGAALPLAHPALATCARGARVGARAPLALPLRDPLSALGPGRDSGPPALPELSPGPRPGPGAWTAPPAGRSCPASPAAAVAIAAAPEPSPTLLASRRAGELCRARAARRRRRLITIEPARAATAQSGDASAPKEVGPT